METRITDLINTLYGENHELVINSNNSTYTIVNTENRIEVISTITKTKLFNALTSLIRRRYKNII